MFYTGRGSLDILVYDGAQNRTYRIYSNITDLVTVITAAHTTPMNRGYLLATDPDIGALIVVVF